MPLIDPCLLVVSNLPGVALGVDGLPGFVRRSRNVLQRDGLVANVAGDLPILLVCHLFESGGEAL